MKSLIFAVALMVVLSAGAPLYAYKLCSLEGFLAFSGTEASCSGSETKDRDKGGDKKETRSDYNACEDEHPKDKGGETRGGRVACSDKDNSEGSKKESRASQSANA